jgi:hypothetical protein
MQKPEIGTRVRLATDADLFPHGIVPAGAEGIVSLVGTDGQPSYVRLDQDFDFLFEWQNELMVFDDPALGVSWDHLEPAVPAPGP